MILLISLFLIVTKAVIDGLRDGGKKTASGVVEFFYLAIITLITFAWVYSVPNTITIRDTYLITIIGFLLLRYGIFSPIYNWVSGQELSFIGSTKYFDIFGKLMVSKFHISSSLILFIKAIATFWGTCWLLGWRNGILPL